jgi:small conductance mechanosensitive channel
MSMDWLRPYLDLDVLVTRVVAFLPNVVTMIFILAGFWILYRLTRRPLRATLLHAGLHVKLVELLVDSIYRYTVAVIGIVMALDQLGVNVGAALAGIGVVGVAVGFAAQDSLANTIAGFMIFWDKPFLVGDWLEVEGQFGMVQDITLRSTRIRTPRNTFVVIPNKKIIDAVLENSSKHGEIRLDVPIGIAYKENVDQAREVLLAAMAALPDLRRDPAPTVVVEGLGDSSVNLLVRVWIDEGERISPVRFDVVEAAKKALDAAGIQIPFPHLQLFWDDVRPEVIQKLRTVVGGAN